MARVQSSTGPGWRLEVERNMIDVMGYTPTVDPRWRSTDSNGHEHYAESNGYVSYPTLRWVVDQEDYFVNEGTDDDPVMEEYPGWGHFECIECGVEVRVGILRPNEYMKQIPGTVSARLIVERDDGAEVTILPTKEEFDEITQAPESAKRDIVARICNASWPDRVVSVIEAP